jgi:DNA-binding transcriptional MerR regulator
MAEYRKAKVIEALNPKDPKKKIVDISGPKLAYYLKLGIVIPDVANPTGYAETKYYSAGNLVDIAIARTLENKGLQIKAIAKVMDLIRKEIRSKYKKLKNIYRLQLIISDPNTDKSEVYLQMCLKPEYQKIKNPVDPKNVKLNMDEADSYLVVDLSKLIARMTHLF